MCSLPNKVSHGQNDCLSFKLKWQDVAKCLECWYFAQNILPGNTAHELNWNELILMFIPEIMTSIGLLICIISANYHKFQQFTSFQFTYDGTRSEEHVSSIKLFNKSYLHVANFS